MCCNKKLHSSIINPLVLFIGVTLSLVLDLGAQDATITGELYHYTGVGIKSVDGQQRILAERNRLNLFAETETGKFTWFAELEIATDLGFLGETNISSSAGFEQIYLKYSDRLLDATVGFQPVNWGFANGLYGLDVLQVFDLSEALTQDYASIRRATWSGLFSIFPTSTSSIDFYLSPGAHPAGLPDPDSPWGLNGVLPFETGQVEFLDDDVSDRDFAKPEIALRLNLQSDIADYSITYMDVFSRLPAISIQAGSDGAIAVQNHYLRNRIAGGSISTSALDPVIVGLELAHNFDALVSANSNDLDESSDPPGFERRDLSSLIVSFTNSNQLFDGQVAFSFRNIYSHDQSILAKQNSLGISASLSRSLLDEKIRLEFQALSPDFKQHWMQGGLRYSISDQLSVFGGAQFYGGEVNLQDPSFPLALYGQKDLVFIEALYSF